MLNGMPARAPKSNSTRPCENARPAGTKNKTEYKRRRFSICLSLLDGISRGRVLATDAGFFRLHHKELLMNVRWARLLAISITVVFGLVSISNVAAQDKGKAPKAEKEQKASTGRQNVQGTVQDISKDTSMITIRNGTRTQSVGYNASTKFLYGHSDNSKPGSVAQVKI